MDKFREINRCYGGNFQFRETFSLGIPSRVVQINKGTLFYLVNFSGSEIVLLGEVFEFPWSCRDLFIPLKGMVPFLAVVRGEFMFRDSVA